MNKKVLVIDDNNAIREVIKVVLEENGYVVASISENEPTIAFVENYKPHIILLDIFMPGINGQDIARQLKAKKTTKHIPIIITSAHSDISSVVAAIGVDSYLEKPFDIDNLVKIVEKY